VRVLRDLRTAAIGSLLAAGSAQAAVVALPLGGRAAEVTSEGVLCGPLPAGWVLDRDRRSVRPPGVSSPAPRSIEVKIAGEGQPCESSKQVLTLVATGAHPGFDPGSVVFAADEGRLELEGERLAGMAVTWRAPERESPGARPRRAGSDVCLAPAPLSGGRGERCIVPLAPGLPSDTVLQWLPAGTPEVEEVVRVFDLQGRVVPPARLSLRPARVLISQLVPPSATVDVSLGPARVPLVHPTAVSAVDCGQARCELSEGAIVVRTVPAPANQVIMRLRLAPRVQLIRGESRETQVSVTLPLVQCPLALASGPPLRETDDSRVVVRVDPRCAREGERARWTVDNEPVEERRSQRVGEVLYVVLRAGRVLGERVVIAARRADLDGTIIGTVSATTAPPPRPRVSLELPKHGKVEFIPTNRDAVLTVAGAGERAKLVPLPIEGAYTVRSTAGHHQIRGDENAGGFVSLRFGYRLEGLPPELGPVDLAVVSERVQRAVREASVPAPFSAQAVGGSALVELTCADGGGREVQVPPSRLFKLPFDSKDTCRLVVHRERLEPEYGLQEVLLEVDVRSAEGSRRSEASFSERLILAPGGEPRLIPLKSGTEEFDRVVVRLSHVLDESRYALSPTGRQGLPSVQWPLVVEGGRLRLYATAAIPAGLYRMNKPTGQLTLNFGVLSRITWLNDQGKEGLLGAELGLMGMGLIQRPGAIDYPPTLGAVAGAGIRVSLGAGAAVGVHVWAAYEFRDDFDYFPDPGNQSDRRRARKLAFIFGPSISIGNVGANL
jgi:hypothetical protein